MDEVRYWMVKNSHPSRSTMREAAGFFCQRVNIEALCCNQDSNIKPCCLAHVERLGCEFLDHPITYFVHVALLLVRT